MGACRVGAFKQLQWVKKGDILSSEIHNSSGDTMAGSPGGTGAAPIKFGLHNYLLL